MMMTMNKTRLALAVAGAVSLVTFTAQAEIFNATATLQDTLAVTVVQEFDIGTVFATATAANLVDGVGAMVISPTGDVSAAASNGTVNVTSLAAPTPAQGSVAMAADFTLTLPTTTTVDATEFDDGGAANVTGAAIVAEGAELIHESANPAVPSLYLVHYTVSAVSGGTVGTDTANNGVFAVTQDFGETEFVFNIGATVTTEPSASVQVYQAGIYSGTFEVTAAY